MKSIGTRFQHAELKLLVSRRMRQVFRFAVILFLSTAAYAQYGGTPGMGTSGTSYGHGAAIGIGVGAAAGGVAAIYLLTHRVSKVTGCVEASNDGLRLTDDKTQKSLSLVNGTADIKSGERVQLKGKIKKGTAGDQDFLVKSVSKDYGPCQKSSAAASAH